MQRDDSVQILISGRGRLEKMAGSSITPLSEDFTSSLPDGFSNRSSGAVETSTGLDAEPFEPGLHTQDEEMPASKAQVAEERFAQARAQVDDPPAMADLPLSKTDRPRWNAVPKEEPVDHSKHDYRGWADKGKDMIFGRKKKGASKGFYDG